MKKMLLVIGVLLLVTMTANAQTAKVDSAKTTVEKAELIKKYEGESKTIQELITKRVNELIAVDAVYNQLLGMKSNYDKLIKELKPTTNKQEVEK